MSGAFDVAVIGAGPAGMAAAIQLRQLGQSVLVVDEQAQPGGQIWRGVERNAGASLAANLGKEYQSGTATAARLRASGATLRFGTQMWQIEDGWHVFLTSGGAAERVKASVVLLAQGAQERPNPFPGWTLPGVMSVGAAQIALKISASIPDAPVWIAGSGPLPLLYMVQLLALGGRIAGFLDTAPSANRYRAARHLPRALPAWRGLAKGAKWLVQLRRAGVPIVRDVSHIEAIGTNALEKIRYRRRNGGWKTVDADLLLTHEGVVPSVHAGMSLGCKHYWRDDQMCFAPVTDLWGETTRQGLFIAGDGAGIEGAEAAWLRGEIAALGIGARLGALSIGDAARLAVPIRRKLDRSRALRPFLDALYRPRPEVSSPADGTLVCRCEEVTVEQVLEAIRAGAGGPNQVKAATRAGMGPCQGRQCGYTVLSLLAEELRTPIDSMGFFNIRPPLKPVTLGELAALVHEDVVP